MFDTHESLAVRHTGQLIDGVMSSFLNVLTVAVRGLPDDKQHTLWAKLLSKNIEYWEQPELDACYQYILDSYWEEKNVRPPARIVYEYEYQDPEVLKWWCDQNDRHITLAEALEWIKTEECQNAVDEYIKDESDNWTPLPNPSYNPDPLADFGGSNDGGLYDEEEFYIPALNKTTDENVYDFTERWYFVVGQIKYIDSVAPSITAPLKVKWLRLALVSQPITEIFKKKKVYLANVERERELVKTISA
jgi:hypothetical protein